MKKKKMKRKQKSERLKDEFIEVSPIKMSSKWVNDLNREIWKAFLNDLDSRTYNCGLHTESPLQVLLSGMLQRRVQASIRFSSKCVE